MRERDRGRERERELSEDGLFKRALSALPALGANFCAAAAAAAVRAVGEPKHELRRSKSREREKL